ncbi:MAG TPA: serine hydrolase, partial [Dehalococcoidia bacterium]|nr:serine hydrolase [Dehalococcoidia bacterium]
MSRFRYRYGYMPPPRERRERREWWLAVPVVGFFAVTGLIALLISRGGSVGHSAICPPGQDCAAAPAAAPQGGGAVGGGPRTPGDDEPPLITGLAAVVMEEPCGALLFDRNPHLRLAPASLTKMATALVAAERADLSEVVTARVSGFQLAQETDSTVMGLEPGDRVTVRDLLYGMLLPSGNDAAITLAEHVAGSVSSFVGLMNDDAARLGLGDTHFANPHGLDNPALYTSAYDMAALGRELLRRPELAEIVRTPVYQPAWSK